MVAPEKNSGEGGTTAVKVPIVCSVKKFQQTKPITSIERTKKVMDIMKLPAVYRNLCADRGLSNIWGRAMLGYYKLIMMYF